MKKNNGINITSKIIYIIYIIAIIYFLSIKDLLGALIIVPCIIGTFVLVKLNKIYNHLFNNTIVSILIVFIMICILFGVCLNFYDINHFDDFLHVWSGFIGCSVGYAIFMCFSENKQNNIKSKIFFILFIFMFSMGIASLWELIEFALDKYFYMTCQGGGNIDTMTDIFDCFVGSLIMTVYYFFKFNKQ